MVTRLSAEMLVDLPVPQEAQISPDGKRVAVSLSPASRKGEHPTSTIWIVPADGSASEQQLTSGLANDTKPRWSFDNNQLAFLSDRIERGTSQVFLLPLSGGEAQPKTEEWGGVSDLCWLPGKAQRIAYLAIDARDDETRRKREEDRDDANVYGEFWPYARLKVLNLDSGDSRDYSIGEKHIAGISPAPGGDRIALTLWPTPEIDHAMANTRLGILNLDSGELEIITTVSGHPGRVVWAQAGDVLFYVAGAGATAVSSNQIWKVNAQPGAAPTCLTAAMPACVIDIARGGSSAALYALVASGAESSIGVLDPETGSIRTILEFQGDLTSLSTADNTTAAMLGGTPDRPRDVYVISGDESPRRATNFHAWLDDVALGAQEVIIWERAGFTLDGILIWPAGKTRADGPLPTVVSIHGGPYGRWPNAFIPGGFGRWLAEQGYLVFLPNPRGGMGHGQAFAEAVLHTVGDEDYLDIMAGVDMLVEQGIADPDRLGCGGWSQGGFMTAWIVGHTDRFKAGVIGAGVSDWGMMIATSDIPSYENLMGGGNPYEGIGPHSFDRQSPISYVHNVSTPTLIVHGERDERVPVSQGIFFHRGLRAYNVPTELVTYPREPHGLQERNHQLDLLRRVAGWYAKWMPADQA